ncbi:MAG: hypothetical protein ACD_35C00187G0006 [uncultured bacterium]|nr:MAG: hypothetical protein ACD_35C00187G0006 [uncultured bacterium]HCS38662.1 hypothetical protein [Anaerolineaceae bacterium]
MTDFRETRTSQHETGRTQRVATFKATQLIWLFLGIIESIIALRFIFRLIGVYAENNFASFIYGLSNFFVAPFLSLTGAPSAGNMVFEFSSLLAMAIYLLIAWGIERIIYVIFYRPRGPVVVRQTIVENHSNQQSTPGLQQTTRTQTPTGTQQTTVSEQKHTSPPGSI